MSKEDFAGRIRDFIDCARAEDAKRFILRALAVLAVVICLIYVAVTRCSTNVYGSFSHESASSIKEGQQDKVIASTQMDNASSDALAEVTVQQNITVFVSGAVEKPGLYELKVGARIGEAITRAGGIRADGAPDAINLAAPLEDGQQIRIPTLAEAEQMVYSEPGLVTSGSGTVGAAASSTGSGTAAGSGTRAGQSAGSGVSGKAADGRVNINTADLATLQTLTGIGPATAQKIIDYRTVHGSFSKIEGLKSVSGIGEKKYAAIADSICV